MYLPTYLNIVLFRTCDVVNTKSGLNDKEKIYIVGNQLTSISLVWSTYYSHQQQELSYVFFCK